MDFTSGFVWHGSPYKSYGEHDLLGLWVALYLAAEELHQYITNQGDDKIGKLENELDRSPIGQDDERDAQTDKNQSCRNDQRGSGMNLSINDSRFQATTRQSNLGA
jgi:hypothetical protein